jgi:hypothetical protein
MKNFQVTEKAFSLNNNLRTSVPLAADRHANNLARPRTLKVLKLCYAQRGGKGNRIINFGT